MDGRLERVTSAEVILSAGAIASPQLLMLSGVGPANHLRSTGVAPIHDLRGVGANLQDHPHLAVAFDASGPYAFHKELRLDRLALSALRWAATGRGPLGRMPIVGQGFVTVDPAQAQPDVQFQLSALSMAARPWLPGWRPGAGHVLTAAAMQLRPQGRGEITLRSRDPNDTPRIRHGLLRHPADRRTAREMLRFVREFFATEPMAHFVSRESFPGPDVRTDEALDAHIRANIHTSMHAVGTCAMGLQDDAVVDAELKIRGLQGLRVVDASVMPTIVSGNTHASVVMIAEKAADMILGRTPPVVARLQRDPQMHLSEA